MPSLPIKVKYESDDLPRLEMPRAGDLGIDLYSAEDVSITVGKVALVSTGVSVEIPPGYALILKDRSSVSKYAHVLAGVIDESYRGTVKVRFFAIDANNEQTLSAVKQFVIRKGDKIAQAIIVPDLTCKFYLEETDELSQTVRGSNGFGSTGK